MGSKGFSSPCERPKEGVLHLPLRLTAISPHCSGPLLLSVVCDGLNSKCISEIGVLAAVCEG